MFEGDDHIFPNKPEIVLENPRSTWGKTVLSLLLFIAVFLFLFADNYLMVLEITGIILIHELGHFIMMKKYGYKSLNMMFIPLFGAMVSGEKTKVSQRQKFWVSIMGPLPGIIAGVIGMVYALDISESGLLFEISLLLTFINVMNLAPIDPLDGGHIIETLFFPNQSQMRLYFAFLSSVSLIALGFYFEIYLIMIFGFFMSFKVRSLQKSQRIHNDLDEINLDYKKPYKELSNREYWTIRRIFLDNNPRIKEIIPDDLSLWENEKLIVEQVRQILRAEIKKDMSFGQKLFAFLLFLAAVIIPTWLMISNFDAVLATFVSN